MDMTVYEKLIDVMNAKSLSLPAVKCDEYFAFVRELFTPGEAEIAVAMPPGFSNIEKIAEKFANRDVSALAAQLEKMGDQCLVQIKQADGVKLYELLPFIPGITELMFMGGLADERSRKVHQLMEQYIAALRKMGDEAKKQEATPSERRKKVSVTKDVEFKSTVVPIKEITEFLMNAEHIAAGTCICRYQSVLKNEPCGEPINNCLIVGPSAEFAAQRGFAKVITREDAIQRMEEADRAGLIHHYTNSPDHYTNLLCNCCQCHCSIMRGIKKSPVPGSIVIARYSVEIQEDDCTACGACIDRCQMDALKIANEKLTYNSSRCLGCGLCVSVCPTDSLVLKPLAASKIPLKRC
jgi:Na+-translocating ferredoxin:NAD+ oxidoreductase subunit B